MIYAVYVITPAGIAVYERKYMEFAKGEEQLISGFVAAIGQFSRHIFGGEVGQITAGKTQLIVANDMESELTTILVSETRDSVTCVKEIGLKIARLVNSYMKEHNISNKTPKAIEDGELDKEIDSLIISRTKSRDYKRVFLSAATGVGISITVFILMLPLIRLFSSQIEYLLPLSLACILAIFFSGAYVSGFLIADPTWGMRAGILQYVLLSILSMLFVPAIGIWDLVLSPFMVVIAILSGRYGGERGSRKWIYKGEAIDATLKIAN